MAGTLPRTAEAEVRRKLADVPVVAILGPRQCGKTTLARCLLESFPQATRVDLERPSDLAKLRDPGAFFALHRDELVCLDEIQRRPDLFPALRTVVDDRDRNGQFLILGSASPELLRQSSESLAGRIAFVELRPMQANLGKRLVRSVRLYLRDQGTLHTLLDIASHDALLGHPSRGVSWEGMVIEHSLASFPGWRASFFRTRGGAELDLVLERGQARVAVEAKVSTAPVPTKGFWTSLEDLGVSQAYIVAPVKEAYPLAAGVAVLPLSDLLTWAPRIAAGQPHPATGH